MGVRGRWYRQRGVVCMSDGDGDGDGDGDNNEDDDDKMISTRNL